MIESSSAYEGEPYVFTHSGRRFYLNNPEFSIEDIAHSLCNNVRFNGHINFPYSVGQHSMLVTEIVQLFTYEPGNEALRGDAVLFREALLHDATEAYLTDIPSPFKQLLPDWRAIDKALEAAWRKTFHVPQERSRMVTLADWYALFMESTMLLPPGAAEAFKDPLGVRNDALAMMMRYQLDEWITPMRLERDKTAFWKKYGMFQHLEGTE